MTSAGRGPSATIVVGNGRARRPTGIQPRPAGATITTPWSSPIAVQPRSVTSAPENACAEDLLDDGSRRSGIRRRHADLGDLEQGVGPERGLRPVVAAGVCVP